MTEPSRSSRSQVMLASEGMIPAISSKMSRTWVKPKSVPIRRAISWVIHQSWRASPGVEIAGRPSCTCRLVLV